MCCLQPLLSNDNTVYCLWQRSLSLNIYYLTHYKKSLQISRQIIAKVFYGIILFYWRKSLLCSQNLVNRYVPISLTILTIGRGNGNPLQCSCLENPMERGAWWATVHGVPRFRHDLATKPPPYLQMVAYSFSKTLASDVVGSSDNGIIFPSQYCFFRLRSS